MDAHRIARVGSAAEEALPGGCRSVARCSCGWNSRAALSPRLARADWRKHAGY